MRIFTVFLVSLALGCGGDGGGTTATTEDASAGTGDASAGTEDTGGSSASVTLSELETDLFQTSCSLSSVCHGGSAPKGAGLSLEPPVYDKIVNVDSTQQPGTPLVKPGDPDGSYLFIKCQASPPVGTPMPQGRANGLDAERLEKLREWILAGAPND